MPLFEGVWSGFLAGIGWGCWVVFLFGLGFFCLVGFHQRTNLEVMF